MSAKPNTSQKSESAPQINYLVATVQKVSVPNELPEEFTTEYFTEQETLRAAILIEREKAEYKMREMILMYADKLGCIDDATEFLSYENTNYADIASYKRALQAVYFSTSKAA